MFKKGDKVKITRCSLYPEMVGKVGRITKVYSPFYETAGPLYRVNVQGRMLKGVATDDDLSLISSENEHD